MSHFTKLRAFIDMEKLGWQFLSENPSAIHLLEANQDKIYWYFLSRNPSIFEYDYKAMKDRMYNSGLFEGLMKNRFHPINVLKFEDWGHESIF